MQTKHIHIAKRCLHHPPCRLATGARSSNAAARPPSKMPSDSCCSSTTSTKAPSATGSWCASATTRSRTVAATAEAGHERLAVGHSEIHPASTLPCLPAHTTASTPACLPDCLRLHLLISTPALLSLLAPPCHAHKTCIPFLNSGTCPAGSTTWLMSRIELLRIDGLPTSRPQASTLVGRWQNSAAKLADQSRGQVRRALHGSMKDAVRCLRCALAASAAVCGGNGRRQQV